jgi:hypothetical protein
MATNLFRKSLKVGMISTLLAGLCVNNVLATDTEATAELQNIALHKPYTVIQTVHDKQLMAYEERTDGDNGQVKAELTDGKVATINPMATSNFSNTNWVGYSRQVGRSVVIDLGKEMFVSRITGGFLQEREAAIDMPRYVNFFVSNDGETWYEAGKQKPDTSVSNLAERKEITEDKINVTARYVKVEFEVGMFSFVDEISVFGREANGVDKKATKLKLAEPDKNKPLPDQSATAGIKNMYLAFLYPEHTGNGPLGTWRKEDFKGVITHVNEKGESDNWMFDTVHFQNGGNAFNDYKDQPLWQEAIDKLFHDNVNLNALEQATAEAKETLGDANYKTKVVLSIPYPDLRTENWGTVDGNVLNFSIDQPGGEKESFKARKMAVVWYIEQLSKKFKEKNYQHIELVGFYWIHEEVGFKTIYEEALLKHTSNTLHDNGYKFFWIPFFHANGSTIWDELGFDAIMLQPNYYFQSFFGPNSQKGGEIDLSRLEATIATAKRFGMGVEVEGDYHMLWNGWGKDYDGQLYHSEYAKTKYYAYLNEIHKAGLDQTLVGYYIGARTVLPQIMKDPLTREVYEETYKFTRNQYETKELSTTTYPPPSGDTWDNPTNFDAVEGDVYTTPKAINKDQWYKFPVKAGESWVVTLTPLEGGFGFESRLWAETQTAHSGFSYNKENSVQSLIVTNPAGTDNYAMLRVFPKAGNLGRYKISLSKPVADGTSMLNSFELKKGEVLAGEAIADGQEIWYRVTGTPRFSNFKITLLPSEGVDGQMQLFYDFNSGYILKSSNNIGAGIPEVIEYLNNYAESFVYYVKVKVDKKGTFTITSN